MSLSLLSPPIIPSSLPETEKPGVIEVERGTIVEVHALSAGHFSLPEEQFVCPSSHDGRTTVPSLSFLVQHTNSVSGKKTRIVFDLGLRRDISRYAEPIRRHAATRQPMTTQPDVVKSLQAGGLTPKDIDYVIYSHVHWDHVGEPRDFPTSTFIVGYGSLELLQGTSSSLRGGHSFFEDDLLDPKRTIQLSAPNVKNESGDKGNGMLSGLNPHGTWESFDELPAVLDLFQDGSLYIVDAPGHLPGHINLLARISDDSNGSRWIYLAGDACHDRRIIRGEKTIGEWHDEHGHLCCIHADRAKAEETIERIRILENKGVEVIFAHDVEWESRKANHGRFFGASS